jgi:hypothetical protein
MAVVGCRHPVISSRSEKDFPVTMYGSPVGPSAVKNKQPSSLRNFGEGPMEVRVKKVF